ncbi:FMN-dependent NADH-azoreductase [Staphylococcus hyicus]|uniref:FMN-dependent NADH-azoreductase n=1 Tax=Staphylococcus hyicus TaxID=1284 RepID=UPI00208FCF78|nr:FMN-dependent NADH-azoreductase [Staphylococcus hyicus]MCO4330602.1 FMN-dependent NADH-azoreductase [Staphylococcus hyicus]MCO4333000.1 FMN-dependent NADH-azoreductase [Staphylococcus hyicus]UWF56989.1 FMN-dependent NADH-azoreductase [Staphylococcus hyicus]
MSKLLFITAHPLNELVSNSMAVGQAFIESYKNHHPEDDVIHIDLFETYVPHLDGDVFTAWGKRQNGDTLSKEEEAKISRLNELSEQFVDADKYVFVTPMWNLSFPPVVKAYIDAVAVAGKTFKYTSDGPVGLLTNKKALHIQSRGGYYTEAPANAMEFGDRYLHSIMTFFGIPSYDTVIIEGHNKEPERREEIKAAAILKAQKLGQTF